MSVNNVSKRAKIIVGLAIGFCGWLGSAKAQTTVTFQNGVDGYSGLFDLYIGTDGFDQGASLPPLPPRQNYPCSLTRHHVR